MCVTRSNKMKCIKVLWNTVDSKSVNICTNVQVLHHLTRRATWPVQWRLSVSPDAITGLTSRTQTLSNYLLKDNCVSYTWVNLTRLVTGTKTFLAIGSIANGVGQTLSSCRHPELMQQTMTWQSEWSASAPVICVVTVRWMLSFQFQSKYRLLIPVECDQMIAENPFNCSTFACRCLLPGIILQFFTLQPMFNCDKEGVCVSKWFILQGVYARAALSDSALWIIEKGKQE